VPATCRSTYSCWRVFRPHPNQLASLSSHPRFSSSVPSVSVGHRRCRTTHCPRTTHIASDSRGHSTYNAASLKRRTPCSVTGLQLHRTSHTLCCDTHTHTHTHGCHAIFNNVRENVRNNLKTWKVMPLLDFETCVKTKRTYSFTGHLITLPWVINCRKSVGLPVSHQHQTSCSEMQTQQAVQLFAKNFLRIFDTSSQKT